MPSHEAAAENLSDHALKQTLAPHPIPAHYSFIDPKKMKG